MTCPTCGNPAAEPCAWGACPDCHAAHLCEPIERKAVLRSGNIHESLTYPDAEPWDVTEVWSA